MRCSKPCPLCPQSRPRKRTPAKRSCLLYPRKRTCAVQSGMFALGQWRILRVGGKLLQILFDRGISDRHVDQCSPKARDDLVVFCWIDSDAAEAPPQHAVILGAITSGRVPVRVDDPFSIRRWVDLTSVRAIAPEDGNA